MCSFLPVASRPQLAVPRPGGAGVLLKHPVHCSNRVSSQFVPGPEGRYENCRWGQPPGGESVFSSTSTSMLDRVDRLLCTAFCGSTN
jgi:hypothetical protein